MKLSLRAAAASIAAWTPSSALAQSLAAPLPAPQPIVAGFDAKPCQFPSAVAMMTADDFAFCTGTLVHPELVLYAGHCFAAAETAYVAFGERADAPARTVETAGCAVFPGFIDTAQSIDLAYCRLAQPVTDVPIVPLATGCEIDEIGVGDEVTIVGFGANAAALDDNGEPTAIEGTGIKRYTKQTIEQIDLAGNDLVLFGGGSSACYGDSGGPVMIELSDGSWRVLGAASTTHPDPGGDPDPCGYGVVYEIAWAHLDWLETSGDDLTPCYDGDVFAPGPGCAGFPSAPGELGHTWTNGCTTSNLVDAPLCAVTDATPPTLAWISPNADVHDAADSLAVSIAIDATDDDTGVAEVWLRIDGADQPSDLDVPPFTFAEVVFPAGSYELVALARDHAGNVGMSAPLQIEVGVEDAPGTSSGDEAPEDPSLATDVGADALPPYLGVDEDPSAGCRVGDREPSAWWLCVCLAVRPRRRPSLFRTFD